MEQEVMNVFMQFINTVGFPIFVAVYMLMKGSRDSKELTKAVNELTMILNRGNK